MVTTDQDRKPSRISALLDRAWSAAAWPMLPLGLGLWVLGIAAGWYWIIVCGTLTMAAGAYRITDR